MNDKDRSGEDIAGLFSAFGGDVGQYQEFDNAPSEPRANWTLLQRLGADPREASASARSTAPLAEADAAGRAAAPAPVPPSAPAAGPPGPALVARPFVQEPAWVAEPVLPPDAATAFPAAPRQEPRAAPATARPAGTPLAALFERLAQAPATDAPQARHSLMAHWRQSG